MCAKDPDPEPGDPKGPVLTGSGSATLIYIKDIAELLLLAVGSLMMSTIYGHYEETSEQRRPC